MRRLFAGPLGICLLRSVRSPVLVDPPELPVLQVGGWDPFPTPRQPALRGQDVDVGVEVEGSAVGVEHRDQAEGGSTPRLDHPFQCAADGVHEDPEELMIPVQDGPELFWYGEDHMAMGHGIERLSKLICPLVGMPLPAAGADAAPAGEGMSPDLSAPRAPVGEEAVVGVAAAEHLLNLCGSVCGEVWVLSPVALPVAVGQEDALDRDSMGR